MFSQKDVRVFLKAYNDRGDSLKQGITHILMKEKDVCNELRSIFATWKIITTIYFQPIPYLIAKPKSGTP